MEGLLREMILKVTKQAGRKFLSVFSTESSISLGDFLYDNSRLLSLVGIFSAISVAFPELLPEGSRESSFGVLGVLATLLIVLSVVQFRILQQVVRSFAEDRFIRLGEYLALSISLLLVISSLIFAAERYLSLGASYIDIWGLGIVMYFFLYIGLKINSFLDDFVEEYRETKVGLAGHFVLQLSIFPEWYLFDIIKQYGTYSPALLGRYSYAIFFAFICLTLLAFSTILLPLVMGLDRAVAFVSEMRSSE